MLNSIFITGTDTGVGKTLVTGLLAGYLSETGMNVVTQKWVQTGCAGDSSDIKRHLELMEKDESDFSGFKRDMVPYNLSFPASPHLAAKKEKINIDPEKIENSFRRLEAEFDMVIVEGVGGAKVPLNKETLIVDIAQELRLPVLIVAENRLGTINHTLLTIEAIKNRKLPILGIIFNRASEDGDPEVLEDNILIVDELGGEDVLGELPYSEDDDMLRRLFAPIGNKVLERLNRE